MILLEEISSDLIDESARLTNTLRKAQMLAHQLNLPELGDWVKYELEGYQNDDVPEYRHKQLPVYGTFGPRTPHQDISSILPQQLRDNVQDLAILHKIAILEEMQVSHEQESHRTFTKELTDILRQTVQMSDGTVLVDAYQRVPAAFLAGILDSVKNRLLSFVLDLQGMNATPEALSDGNVAREAIRQSFNINVYGSHNVIAAGENVSQTVSTVQPGEIDSLLGHLRGHNVDQEDLDDLDDLAGAVSSEPQAKNGQFGTRVNAWIVKMVGKAMSGAWQYSMQNAPAMLMEAISRFYEV